MGNSVGRLNGCFAGEISQRHDIAIYLSDPLDEGLGHSFCYFRSDTGQLSSAEPKTAPFKSISGASLSANTFTPLSTSLYSDASLDKASSFESSDSFAAIPLQPIPRNSIQSVRSGPIPQSFGSGFGSGPIERGFLSGPIERSFISGPFETQFDQIQRYKPNSKKWNLIKNLKKAITNSMQITGVSLDWMTGSEKRKENNRVCSEETLCNESEESFESSNVQWAQGKAGEDRIQVVVSDENGWVFVGIYDGFNGPDATDFLLSNLYSNVHKELKGLLWDSKSESFANSAKNENLEEEMVIQGEKFEQSEIAHHMFDKMSQGAEKENYPFGNEFSNLDCDSRRKKRRKSRNRSRRDEEILDLDRILKEKKDDSGVGISHCDVLKALSEALRKTEESYLEIADLMLMENPELSLMGSCVLAMLMKGEDVYVMNVGDSRAVLARKAEPDLGILERIKEETLNDLQAFDGDEFDNLPKLASLQLTIDHSTSVENELKRIKKEHKDDACAITNDRVKGSLKVTRAFGAGFLKKPKWNNALLEMFRIDYVGTSPYITCSPSLSHHRLGPRDRFLILSSDGLYQYFTNEEAISEVETFISSFPEGDPAQHLVEEVLFRAAKRAGMDFHELLDIPQGDRRRYHDDVSIIIISFEGRIWRSAL
ncbi:Protein like [Actinidia chinensis var. chinensis]|uniref:protein-serine/threonine phosphatase n=1 Tax=Actinidia chinensis var. chinensis TaxID=1590841 RepID=A0A2R6R886_ACTCC|nr:Protein like [Actinidia chinensis var. chinensis]